MGGFFKMTTDRYPPASLGCGTLIVIAMIVMIITSAGSSNLKDEMKSLQNQVQDLKRSVDAQTDQIRSLKELIQSRSSAPKDAEASSKN